MKANFRAPLGAILCLVAVAVILLSNCAVSFAESIPRYTAAPYKGPLRFEGTDLNFRYFGSGTTPVPIPSTGDPAFPEVGFPQRDYRNRDEYLRDISYIGRTVGDYSYVISGPQSRVPISAFYVKGGESRFIQPKAGVNVLATGINDINSRGQVATAGLRKDPGPNNPFPSVRGNYLFDVNTGDAIEIPTFGGSPIDLALGLNSRGDVVGRAVKPSSDPGSSPALLVGFLFRDGVLTDLNDLLLPDSLYKIDTGIDIDDSGRIIALGSFKDGSPIIDPLLLTPSIVPEPSSWFIGATLTVAALAWRRMRRNASGS